MTEQFQYVFVLRFLVEMLNTVYLLNPNDGVDLNHGYSSFKSSQNLSLLIVMAKLHSATSMML